MIVSICIILLLSAFFSGLEIAFVSSNKMLLEMEREHRSLTTRILDRFYRRQSDFITTLLVGTNIALVIYGILMAHLIQSNPLVNTLIATVIVLFVGEFLPKTLFRINPNRAMHFCAVPALFFYFLLWPVSRITSLLAKLLLRCFGLKMKSVQKQNFTKTDLDHLIQSNIDAQSDEEDVEDEVIMFQNALDFGDTRLRDCMVPRNEIVAVDVDDTTREDLVKLFTKSGLSKIVVYKENIDDVIGFIQVSELFVTTVDWKKRVKPVLFAPETLLARKMMQQLMGEKRSMAIVLDEFGGTSGMVTLEDLVEEIFGEIEDEHDRNHLVARQLNEDSFEFAGRMEIEEINERFHLDIPESDDYQTLAGYLLDQNGAIPNVGEVFDLPPYRFTIERKTAARIELIRVDVIKPDAKK